MDIDYITSKELRVLSVNNINLKNLRYFSQQAYQECVDTCIKAIDVGRENRADFKLIAKALARMGKAYTKLNDLYNARYT